MGLDVTSYGRLVDDRLDELRPRVDRDAEDDEQHAEDDQDTRQLPVDDGRLRALATPSRPGWNRWSEFLAASATPTTVQSPPTAYSPTAAPRRAEPPVARPRSAPAEMVAEGQREREDRKPSRGGGNHPVATVEPGSWRAADASHPGSGL